MKKFEINKTENLIKAILSLENAKECSMFFDDIFTVGELMAVSQRIDVAIMLDKGKSYNEIREETGASTATISRVNRCLMYGDGGYNTVLSKIRTPEEK